MGVVSGEHEPLKVRRVRRRDTPDHRRRSGSRLVSGTKKSQNDESALLWGPLSRRKAGRRTCRPCPSTRRQRKIGAIAVFCASDRQLPSRAPLQVGRSRSKSKARWHASVSWISPSSTPSRASHLANTAADSFARALPGGEGGGRGRSAVRGHSRVSLGAELVGNRRQRQAVAGVHPPGSRRTPRACASLRRTCVVRRSSSRRSTSDPVACRRRWRSKPWPSASAWPRPGSRSPDEPGSPGRSSNRRDPEWPASELMTAKPCCNAP